MSLPGFERVTDDLRGLLGPDLIGSLEWPGSGAHLRSGYAEHLRRHPDAAAKAGPGAHFTGSCLVVDESAERVLLTLHAKVGRWLQFGGHLEASDASVAAGALREAVEESGIADADLSLLPGPVQLDRHPLGSGFSHCREHLDLRWVAVARSGAAPAVSSESLDVAWWPIDALPEGTEPAVRALAERAASLVADR